MNATAIAEQNAVEAIKSSYRQTKDGVSVTFVIHPQEMPDALALAPLGSRWMVALVPIGDDENPEQAAQSGRPDPSPAPIAPRSPGAAGKPAGAALAHIRERKLSEQAWWFVTKDKAFQDWMYRGVGGKDLDTTYDAFSKNRARLTDAWLKNILEIASKSELDTDEKAARSFTLLIEKFERHMNRIPEHVA